MDFPSASPEAPARQARNDLIAWIWGGAVWSAVMVLICGEPPMAVFGAAFVFCLRRALGPFVAF